MTVRLDGEIIRLQGRCHVEDAEPLLALLQSEPSRIVDCSAADALHSSVVQVLVALDPVVQGETSDAFLRRWVMPRFKKVPVTG